MQIKVTRIEDGPARVEVINPENNEVVSSTDVNVGQQVEITTSDGAENPPFIGEVCAIEEPAGTGGGETEAGESGGGSGEEPGGAETPA